MKCLIIGGNRFVGMRLSLMLEKISGIELHILNRTGQAPHCKTATVHKGDRRNLSFHSLDQDWDIIFDFACFNQYDAEGSIRFFKNVRRYIFISTATVYDSGKNLKESAFAAEKYDLQVPSPSEHRLQYQEGKRRAEAVFAQQNRIPVLSVRLPFVLGLDDYTHRLEFHIDRIGTGQSLFIPNLTSEISLVDSTDAARFLSWAADKDFNGAINVASPGSLSIGGMLAQIESLFGVETVLAKEADENNASPYALVGDMSLDVEALASHGFSCRKINEWLPELIRSHAGARKPTNLH